MALGQRGAHPGVGHRLGGTLQREHDRVRGAHGDLDRRHQQRVAARRDTGHHDAVPAHLGGVVGQQWQPLQQQGLVLQPGDDTREPGPVRAQQPLVLLPP